MIRALIAFAVLSLLPAPAQAQRARTPRPLIVHFPEPGYPIQTRVSSARCGNHAVRFVEQFGWKPEQRSRWMSAGSVKRRLPGDFMGGLPGLATSAVLQCLPWGFTLEVHALVRREGEPLRALSQHALMRWNGTLELSDFYSEP